VLNTYQALASQLLMYILDTYQFISELSMPQLVSLPKIADLSAFDIEASTFLSVRSLSNLEHLSMLNFARLF